MPTDLSVAIEAVTDAAGERQATLTLPGDQQEDQDSPLTALREAAADSPALVWVKDLEGRYLYVNERFEQSLETSDERLRGNLDADLPAVETVDGPRLRYIEDGLEEPLQLEYTVPAYESRPAMAAFRFPLRNEAGQPVAICGVAAANSESHVAGDEAVRLMELERWNRRDAQDVRAELLERWDVRAEAAEAAAETPERTEPVEAETAEPDTAAGAPAPDDASYPREDEWVRQLRQAARISAADAISETAGALQTDLQLARKWAERADQLQSELQQAHARLRDAEAEARRAAAAAQLAADEASRYKAELERATEDSERVKTEFEQAGKESQRARAELKQAGEETLRVGTELEQARAASSRLQDELERAREELEQTREELEREHAEADAARAELEVARRELGSSRAQSESLRGPSDAALRLSEELGRALGAERERGDELARALARIRSRLGDFEGALDRSKVPARKGS